VNVIVHEPEASVDGVDQEGASENKCQHNDHRDRCVFDQGLGFGSVFHWSFYLHVLFKYILQVCCLQLPFYFYSDRDWRQGRDNAFQDSLTASLSTEEVIMSFLYNPRKKRPQIWTFPVFIGIPIVIFWGIYSYGLKKAAESERLRGAAPVEDNAMF